MKNKNQGSYDVFGRFTRHSSTRVFNAFCPRGRHFSKRVPDRIEEEFDFPFAVFGIVSNAPGREMMRVKSTTSVRFCRNEAEVEAAHKFFTKKGCDTVVTTKTSVWA